MDHVTNLALRIAEIGGDSDDRLVNGTPDKLLSNLRRVPGLGSKGGFRCRVSCLGSRVQGLGSRV